MVSVTSTLSQAASAYTALPVSSLANSTSWVSSASNFTSSLLPSTQQLLRFPLRVIGRLDRTILHILNHYLLGSIIPTGIAGGNLAAGDIGAHAMADAAAQPGMVQGLADPVVEGWAAFFAEAFQASTFKSYWGMIHYLTSRWAFTCFTLVCSPPQFKTEPLLTNSRHLFSTVLMFTEQPGREYT